MALHRRGRAGQDPLDVPLQIRSLRPAQEIPGHRQPALIKRLVDSALYHGTRWVAPQVGARVARWPEGRKVVSFTFDDFPRSAARVGAEVVEAHAARATYYVSMGL